MKYLNDFELAIKIRTIEENLLDLFNKGLINGTVHTCIGQEFSAVSVMKYLNDSDFVISNHRGHGHYIAKTNDIEGLVLELMGDVRGCTGGIGGSQHLYNKNYLSNGIQGGMMPIAAGIAFANKIFKNNSISVIFIGDGTLGQGLVYETLNIAAKWRLPLLVVLENNNIAQSTSHNQTFAGSIEERCKGFGISYSLTSTNDLDNLFSTTKSVIDKVRKDSICSLIEIKTNRLNSHSKGDDNRSIEEVEIFKKNDLLNIFKKENEDVYIKIKDEIELLINKIVSKEKKTLKNFYNREYVYDQKLNFSKNNIKGKRYNEELYISLKKLMNENEKVYILGEDIETCNEYNPGEYGGAFKVTRDLSLLFPYKVKNTPISEPALVGIGTGMSISGLMPIIEIMFGDFMTLVFDQILQHASKFNLMYNGNVKVPLLIRTPMGGYRGYGPTHSQSLEKYFMGIPDLNIVAINYRVHPQMIFDFIYKNFNNPHILVENKIVYTQYVNETDIEGFDILVSDNDYPFLKISSNVSNSDVTILCYGGVLKEVEEAMNILFIENEITCEVLCPSLIFPININPIIESVQKTGKLLIIEEGTSAMAYGSEIISLLNERNIYVKKVKRLGNNTIIPSSITAERNLLVNKKTIIKNILSL